MRSIFRLFTALLICIVLFVSLVFIGSTSHQLAAPRAPATTPTPPPTPTPTTTSNPAPPTLIAPDDAALLPQPIPPEQWVFEWNSCALLGYCWSTVTLVGPAGQRLSGGSYVTAEQRYRFVYTSTDYLPLDALGPWHWSATAYKLNGLSHSETRTFWVAEPPSTRKLFLALILKDD